MIPRIVYYNNKYFINHLLASKTLDIEVIRIKCLQIFIIAKILFLGYNWEVIVSLTTFLKWNIVESPYFYW